LVAAELVRAQYRNIPTAVAVNAIDRDAAFLPVNGTSSPPYLSATVLSITTSSLESWRTPASMGCWLLKSIFYTPITKMMRTGRWLAAWVNCDAS